MGDLNENGINNPAMQNQQAEAAVNNPAVERPIHADRGSNPQKDKVDPMVRLKQARRRHHPADDA